VGKKIVHFRTFLVTLGFSCFAYFWMFLVLYVITPARIDIWEAILTLLWYPLMILAVWLVEKPEKHDNYLKYLAED